ncbi:MAG TPA: hypothetical protein VJK05_03960 [archaeon]|nr:hypothetical protein [archaeon]
MDFQPSQEFDFLEQAIPKKFPAMKLLIALLGVLLILFFAPSGTSFGFFTEYDLIGGTGLIFGIIFLLFGAGGVMDFFKRNGNE